MNPNTGIVYLLLALAIGFAVRTLKNDAFVFPPRWHIPPAARPLLALALGALGGAVDMMARGTPWKDALLQGLGSAALAMTGHAVLVEGANGGQEPFSKPVAPPPVNVMSVFERCARREISPAEAVALLSPPSSLAKGEIGSDELTPRQR